MVLLGGGGGSAREGGGAGSEVTCVWGLGGVGCWAGGLESRE